MIAGIILVSAWMGLSLLYSWLLLGLGSNYVCQSGPGQDACFDRYQLWQLLLLGLHLVTIVAAILLWRRPRVRVWGFIVGILGTGCAAIVFTLVFRVPL